MDRRLLVAEAVRMIHNPVLSGFHPDPSITRVGDRYFLATSTFGWLPGIRLFTSTDLQHWELVGHALTGRNCPDLRGSAANAGVWAPALSFHQPTSTFYLTYSLMRSTTADLFDVDNFVVTATDFAGPWTLPTYLNSIGFDPSMFHDDDGRHWLVTLEWDTRDGYQHPGSIVLEEYDAGAKRIVGPAVRISHGATDRGCLEAPHLYRHDGYYYLMTAEGGTGFGHAVALSRSRNIQGPYEPAPDGPFLTSAPFHFFGRNDRDFLKPHLFNPNADLQKAGHGSLVDTGHGEWFVVHLSARPLLPSQKSVLGRETSIQKVEWTESGWLTLASGGIVAKSTTGGINGQDYPVMPSPESLHENFDDAVIDNRFFSIRAPIDQSWLALDRRPGFARLRGRHALTCRFDVSLLATPLQHFRATAVTSLDFIPTHFTQSAGLTVYYNEENFVFLRCYYSESLGGRTLGIMIVRDGLKSELRDARVLAPDGIIHLRAAIDQGSLSFDFRTENLPVRSIGDAIDITFLSDESTRGFTGTMVGIVAQDGFRRQSHADFDHFHLDYPADQS